MSQNKRSPFNILLPGGSEDTRILFNSLTRRACEVDRSTAEAVHDPDRAIPDAEVAALEEMGALTTAPDQQRERAYEAFREEKNNRRNLVLVLPMTNRCNLKCTYCYQVIHGDFQGPGAVDVGSWDAERIASLVSFVEQELVSGEYEGVRIRWYGGEPLLKLGLIEEIGGRIRRVAEDHGRTLSGMVVTNGMLLGEKPFRVLEEVNVDRLEISIDGPRETHDKLRPLQNGAGTYEQIFERLEQAAAVFGTIVFRVNVHSLNAARIPDWLPEVAKRITAPNIALKFKLVEGDASNALTYTEFSTWVLRYTALARRLGLRMLGKQLTTETCPAIRPNYFIIEPTLRVYKCPQNLGSDDHVGRIEGDGHLTVNENMDRWLGYDVARDSSCQSCAHLPHCNGGCPYNQIMGQVNRESLEVYRRKERCCHENHIPEHLVLRII